MELLRVFAKQGAYLDRLNGLEPLLELPFPEGFKGLPVTAVRAALAWLDYIGVTNATLRKLQVYFWVLELWPSEGTGTPLYESVDREHRHLAHDLGDQDPHAL